MTLLLSSCLLILLSGICVGDELRIIESYPGVKFSSQHIDSSTVLDLFLNTLGIVTKKRSVVKPVSIKSPFSYSDALVVVEASHPFVDKSVATLKLSSPVAWEDVEDRMKLQLHKNLGDKALTLKILSDNNDEDIPTVEVKHLNVSDKDDRQFLNHIEKIREVGNEISQEVPVVKTVIWIYDAGYLSDMATRYGDSTPQLYEATELFSSAVSRIVNTLKKHHNKVLYMMVIGDNAGIRVTRSLLQYEEAQQNSTVIGNLAYQSSGEFAVVFNIVLWLSIILVLSLIAISIGIGYMDPGRDSIIYRMTSQRMKKDQ